LTEGIWNIQLPAAQEKMTFVNAPNGWSEIFGSVWLEPIKIKWASIWRVLALAKAKASEEPESH
jgi:hypothetical protein